MGRTEILARIEDVRVNMPWSDDRDALLDDLYDELAENTCDVEDCNNELDGDSYDGYCADHADQFEAEGRWG